MEKENSGLRFIGVSIRYLVQSVWVGCFCGMATFFSFASAMAEDTPGRKIPIPSLMDMGTAYPDSRFGTPPGQPELEVGPDAVKRALQEIDPRDLPSSPNKPSSRSIASVQSVQTYQSVPPPSEVHPRRYSTENPMAKPVTQEIGVIEGDSGFFPQTISVTRDVPVHLYVTGASKRALCFMLDEFKVQREIRAFEVEEIAFTPRVVTQYRFYCPINGKEGKMIVKEPILYLVK